ACARAGAITNNPAVNAVPAIVCQKYLAISSSLNHHPSLARFGARPEHPSGAPGACGRDTTCRNRRPRPAIDPQGKYTKVNSSETQDFTFGRKGGKRCTILAPGCRPVDGHCS